MPVSRMILTTLAGVRPSQRLQLVLSQEEDGRLLFELCEQHHADGIGWFDQRTIRLEPWQLRQLQAVVGTHPAVGGTEPDAPRSTIPFPGPDATMPRRATGTHDR